MSNPSRRAFLVRGLALVPLLRVRGAFAAEERRLRVLHVRHVAPEYDAYLAQFATSFGQAQDCRVDLDTVAVGDVPAVVAAELGRNDSHDVLTLDGTSVWRFADRLADLTDMAAAVGREGGGWLHEAVAVAVLRGRWTCLPSGFVTFPWIVNRAHLRQVGEDYTDRTSWEDVHRIGTKLKKAGHPIGLPYAPTPFATDILVSLMQSFKALMFDRNGEPAFASKEIVEALRFGTALFRETMTDAVLGWNDASPAAFLGSGLGAMTCSPVSAWRAAVREAGPARGDLAVVKPPLGPGRLRVGALRPLAHAVANSSTVPDLARLFLTELARDTARGLQAAGGTQYPALKRFVGGPMRQAVDHEHLEFLARYGDYGRLVTAPGPLTRAGGILYDAVLVPRMFADVATGRKTPRAAMDEVASALRANH